MPRDAELNPLILTGLSFALLLVVTLLAASPLGVPMEDLNRKLIVGLPFTALLLLGMAVAFLPRICSKRSHAFTGAVRLSGSNAETWTGKTVSTVLGITVVHGHHPSCPRFSSHEFKIGERSFCVSCTGLFAGGALALALTVGLFSSSLEVAGFGVLLPLGVATVALGLLQYVWFEDEPRALRFTLNLLFVLGAFLTLAGVDASTRSLAADLLTVSSSIVWLAARISLSLWKHDRICSKCGLPCGGFAQG